MTLHVLSIIQAISEKKYFIQLITMPYLLINIFYQDMQEPKNEEQALTDNSTIIEPSFSLVIKSISEPQLKCKGGFDIDNVCTNKNCSNPSFHCSNKECQCFKNHIFCQRNWFNGYTVLMQVKEKFLKTFFEDINGIDKEIRKRVLQSNEELASNISLGSLDEKYIQILSKIYLKKDWESFLGVEMEDLFNKLALKNKEDKDRENQLQQIYKINAINIVQHEIQLKKEIFKAYLNGSYVKYAKVDWKPFIDSPLIRACLTTMYANTLQCYKNKSKFGYCDLDRLDADRLAFQKEQILFLQKELYNAVSAELIFTASEHQFKAAEFHRKCDGVENTLTVVRTEFGKTIFAFAAQKWINGNGELVNDPTGRSCIILLDQKKKYGLVNAAQSIYFHPSLGPTFGGGYDLYLVNDCHLNQSSYCNFPTSYNNKNIVNNQVSKTMITGNPSGSSFKVIQYEVFKLTFS